MARIRETVESYVDDLDGTPATETVKYTVAGTGYEIDLGKKNAKAFHADLDKWIAASRKVKAARGPKRGRPAQPAGPNNSAAIREWAAAAGVSVSLRGRIPAAIVEQYNAR